jgi:hypothetical protein
MKVINLNSMYELSKEQLAFAERLVQSCERYVTEDDTPRRLLQDIPIFLVDDATMRNWSEGEQSEMPSVDLLGFFAPSVSILGVRKSVIGLCPERIRKHAALGDDPPTDTQVTWLTGKVLIHELAHAIMREPTELRDAEPDFYKYMEESMANVIALKAIEGEALLGGSRVASAATQTAIEYAREFVRRQPAEYRLAIDLVDNKLGWWQLWKALKQLGWSPNTLSPKFFLKVFEKNPIPSCTMEKCFKSIFIDIYSDTEALQETVA